jgi:formate dehydrogenase iron-sulfur subunit
MSGTAVRVYVPRDALALALGADAVAGALAAACAARGEALQIVRNGSRGMAWLEPLVEVETAAGRVAYGPVRAADVPGLLDAGMLRGGAHALGHGLTAALPWMAAQQRVSFRRVGLIDPLALDDYAAEGGWAGLRHALEMLDADPAAVVDAVTRSGLRGRGGAAFPTGIKWNTVRRADAPRKYIVCNADEGDSGTFADRMLMEGDPYALIEGMAIAGVAVGATQGYIYVRSEYPHAVATLREAVARAAAAGFLGADLLGARRGFDLEVRVGAGSYVCGEETALLESLEGRRGVVRAKPPLPALAGLFGMPTVINNVLTLAALPAILADGADRYAALGVGRSRGTLALQLAGNVARGGLLELAFGTSLREVVEGFGGGTRSGRALKAIQVGGPLGAYLPPRHWDLALDYEAFSAAGAALGHGGIVLHDAGADLAALARHAMEFCAVESCGKCTPCRIGARRGVEVIDRIRGGATQQVALLRELCDTMTHGSLCAMGGMTPFPVLSALDHYPEDFGAAAAA